MTQPLTSTSGRQQVHSIIANHTGESMAVLMTSTDSDELARLCHRVLVTPRAHRAELHKASTSMPPPTIMRTVAGVSI